MAQAITKAVLGVDLQGCWKSGVYLYDVFNSKGRKNLEETVGRLLPIIKQICESKSGEPASLLVQRFQQFHDYIVEGNRVVAECPRMCVIFRKFWIAIRVEKLQKYINEFIQIDLPYVMASEHIQAQISVSIQYKDISDKIEALIRAVDRKNESILQRVTEVRDTQISQDRKMESMLQRVTEVRDTQISQESYQSTCVESSVTYGQNSQFPQLQNVLGEIQSVEQVQYSEISENLSPYLVGFDDHIMELKKFVWDKRVNVVGITAMGGAGKSTLTMALCKDPEINGCFMERVLYISVSESPDLLSILGVMWNKIIGGPAPNFKLVKEAHIQLEVHITLTKSKPFLLILDDVWSKEHLEKLLFEGEQFTTVVTTRDKNVIPEGPKTHVYYLPSLQEEDALSLFCLHAFGQPTIPIDRDKDLVMKVQQECNGLPLALKVIGSSLYGKPNSFWKSTSDDLAREESADDTQINDLLKSLEGSINALNPREKQCFLDLAVFPKGRTIPANVLLDIWVYVRRMKRDNAILLLRKFKDSHLLDLKRDLWFSRASESTDDCMDGYFVSQYDVMRRLALYLAEQDNEIHFSRLYMPQRQSQLPFDRETDGDRLCRAQIVSIHTGAMKDTQWPEMDFPVAEALVLYFSAAEYCIPTFLDTMKRLKVLIIHNDNSKPAKLCGLGGFQRASQLKTLYLERLIAPPLHEDCKGLESLEKMSLVLCAGLGKDTIFNFPVLSEINVDYCIDLEELPAGLCSSVSLKTLSVTHCHRLTKLPDEIDKLELLKEIRLCESLGLECLPRSISSLRKLECLDISSCMGLKVTKQGCNELKSTLEAVAELPSLERVICDKRNEWLFKRSSRTNLKIQVVEEEEPNLEWLDLD